MQTWLKVLIAIAVLVIVIFVIIPMLIVMLAALVFVIQPSQVGGNTCSTTSGILITNHLVSGTEDKITLALSNQTGSILENVDIEVSGTTSGKTVINSLGTITQNESIQLSPGLSPSETYSIQISFSYTDADGLARKVISTCNGTAKTGNGSTVNTRAVGSNDSERNVTAGGVCSTTSGILILNHNLSDETLTLILSNQTAATLENVNVSVGDSLDEPSELGSRVIPLLEKTSASETIQLNQDFDGGTEYSILVNFQYLDRDGLARTVTSTCNGTAS